MLYYRMQGVFFTKYFAQLFSSNNVCTEWTLQKYLWNRENKPPLIQSPRGRGHLFTVHCLHIPDITTRHCSIWTAASLRGVQEAVLKQDSCLPSKAENKQFSEIIRSVHETFSTDQTGSPSFWRSTNNLQNTVFYCWFVGY